MNPMHQCIQKISPGNPFSYVQDVLTRVMLYAPPPHYKWRGHNKAIYSINEFIDDIVIS